MARFCYAVLIVLVLSGYCKSDGPSALSNMLPRSTPINIDIFTLQDKQGLKPVSIYNKVLTCSTKPFGDQYGRSTNVHETVHGINNALSNSRRGYRGFYCGCGRALWLPDVSISMIDIIPFIPNVLKEYRYTLYFVSQRKYWNDVGLYPLDEWSAYICGAECAVDDYNHKRELERTDAVSGMFEFMVYCTALAMCVKDKCPEYWEKNTQFRSFIQYRMDISSMIF